MSAGVKGMAAVAALALAMLATPRPVAAHCDSMDGPVVQAARQALAGGDVQKVLVWVRAQDEAEIRQAFARTLDVRKVSASARELADLWFFETLVRVHRAGEGEPYTGLKPAGATPEPGIAAADKALKDGTIQPLATQAAGELVNGLTERFQKVRSLASYAPQDVEAGRRYVHAYVEYIHYVEKLHGLLHGGADSHAAETAQAEHR